MMGGGGGWMCITMWKVEIGGSKQVESGNWGVKNVESRNCEMKWKVEIEF